VEFIGIYMIIRIVAAAFCFYGCQSSGGHVVSGFDLILGDFSLTCSKLCN